MTGLEYKTQERWYVFKIVHGGILALDDYFDQSGYSTKEDAIHEIWVTLGRSYTDRFILPETQIRRKD